MQQKTIIISGINMVEGGIFTILHNCLEKLSLYSENKNIKIIALVHQKEMFDFPNIEFIEFPKSKKYWLYRLYYEYFYFNKLSKKIKPDYWFSLHDTTPKISFGKQFVYCHNPNSFYKPSIKDCFFDYKIGVFYLFYKQLYKKNIHKNTAIFVQQHWIKKTFEKWFHLKNVKVALPEFTEEITTNKANLTSDKIHFFYPSFPRSLKNFTLIFEAILLLKKDIRDIIQFHFTTIKDNNHKFAKHLYKKYKHLPEVKFHGWLSRKELLSYYNSMDCLLFPSKIETWGLPISEAKAYQKPMLVANMPYAKETVGNYEKVSFFDVNNPEELANLITQFVNETLVFQGNKYAFEEKEQLENWNAVFDLIFAS